MNNSLRQNTQSSASGLSRRWVSALALLVVILLLPLSRAMAQVVDPPTPPPPPPDPKPCTPNGMAPTTCLPLHVGPWKFRDYTGLPYGGQLPGYYKSVPDYLGAVKNWFSWSCYVGVGNARVTGGPGYYVGVENSYTWAFDVTLGTNAGCDHALAGTPGILQWRDITCNNPNDWALVAVGAGYACACKPNAECAPPRCPKGSVSRGNPCDVLSGRKQQNESDYRSTGDFPLEFARGYDSGRLTFVGTEPLLNPIGTGWMGSYLQSVQYANSPERPGAFAHRPNGNIVIFYENAANFSVGDEVGDKLEWVYQSGVKSGFLYTTSADVKELYNLDGRLQSITSRTGIVHTLAYNNTGFVDSVTDSFGSVMHFSWTAASPARLASITLPDGGTIAFGYAAFDNLASVTYPDTRQRLYHYELTDSARVNLLTGITDENGVRFATWGYDSSGRAISSEHAGGVEHYSFAFNSGGSRVVTDPLGTTHTYATTLVANQRRYTGSSAPCGGCSESASATYDSRGNFDTRTDFKGSQTKYIYDLTRNLEIYRAAAFGTPKVSAVATTWHSVFRLPTLIVEPKRSTAYTYDSSGNVLTRTITDTTVTPNVSRVWTYTYNAYGQLLTEDGPRTDVSDLTTYTYYSCSTGYPCGQLHTIVNALGHTTTFLTYNAHGQPLTMTDANGVSLTLTYDTRQRLTSRTVDGETTSFSYWPIGLLKRTTLPDGSYLEDTYDDAHRLQQISDGEGNKIAYTLDAMGNRTSENTYDPTSVLARTRTQVFNSLNQLWKQIGSAGTSAVTTVFSYDANGNQAGANAPLGRDTVNEYDELNRLARITDPASGDVVLGYDSPGNLVSVVDPNGHTTSYTHNGFGEVAVLQSPDTGTSTSTYDLAGNLATKTDARGLTGTYGYDALNRVTSIAYPAESVAFSYDSGANAVGRLSGASDASHSLAWSYDAQGRVASKTQIVGGVTKTIGYSYVSGNLSTTLTPSGQTIAYGYTAGRVTSVAVNGTTVLTGAIYEPFGPVRQWTWGNSSAAVRTYDQDGKLVQLDTGGDFYEYSYDDAFRVTGISNASSASLSWSYGYDSLDRITSATSTPRTEGWTYDANGNRLTESGSAAGQPFSNTLTIAPTSNRVASIGGSRASTYSYDASGNVIGETNAGRPVGTGASTTVSYVYDALSRRIWKSGPSSPTVFVYDEAGHLLGEYGSGGVLIQETVWMNDIPIATLRPRAGGGIDVYYVHTDHLNTPRKVSRPLDNVVVWRWDPSPFGNTVADENPQGAGTFGYNLRFPGQYYDAESGLSYNYARDYDPYTGKYLESDPIGLQGGLNTYAYASGNPISLTDPTGLLSLVVQASWSEVDALPGRGGGLTRAFIAPAKCVCRGCGNSWTLSECSAFLDIQVQLRTGMFAAEAAFYRKSEADHVADLKAGAGSIRQAGEAAEQAERKMVFSSEAACVAHASAAVTKALRAQREKVSRESGERWDYPGGPHTWPLSHPW